MDISKMNKPELQKLLSDAVAKYEQQQRKSTVRAALIAAKDKVLSVRVRSPIYRKR